MSNRLADGSTVSMPDTVANQKAYPQARTQKPGVGFPILRFVVVFSLAVGTVLEATLAPYKGKQTGETSMLWQMLEQLQTALAAWTEAQYSRGNGDGKQGASLDSVLASVSDAARTLKGEYAWPRPLIRRWMNRTPEPEPHP